jgi:hypothetical protein
VTAARDTLAEGRNCRKTHWDNYVTVAREMLEEVRDCGKRHASRKGLCHKMHKSIRKRLSQAFRLQGSKCIVECECHKRQNEETMTIIGYKSQSAWQKVSVTRGRMKRL